MKYKQVIAMINNEKLEDVEKALIGIGVSGVTLSQVCGYGEYHNFYRSDLMCKHIRMEIFCAAQQAESIAHCIMQAAHIGQPGDGLVAVMPVDGLYRIRSLSEYQQEGE